MGIFFLRRSCQKYSYCNFFSDTMFKRKRYLHLVVSKAHTAHHHTLNSLVGFGLGLGNKTNY